VFHTCSWTITGDALVPQGTYDIEVTITDKDGGMQAKTVTLNVVAEDGEMAFDGANPPVVQVEADGGDSPSFVLRVYAQEVLPDATLGNSAAAAGDIGEAVVAVSLVPVGPGGTETVLCIPVNDPAAFDYDGVLTVDCAFVGVAVNTYSIEATLIAGNGGLFYTGFADDVITIFDPSLGFTTGGGHVAWPGSDNKTNFGFTVQYGKKQGSAKGSLLMMQHLSDGTKYRVKSNAMIGLAVGEVGDLGWASFTGKCTYQDPSMADPEGNYSFVAYVEDLGEPGAGVDRIWLQVRDKSDNLISEFSLPDAAVDNAATIDEGNIVVPHTGRRN